MSGRSSPNRTTNGRGRPSPRSRSSPSSRPVKAPASLESGPSTIEIQEMAARRYQLEVVEFARTRNTISYLDTGAGKTFIAGMHLLGIIGLYCTFSDWLRFNFHLVLLIKELIHLFRTHDPAKRKWCIFLAPTVALVTQQVRNCLIYVYVHLLFYFLGKSAGSCASIDSREVLRPFGWKMDW